MTRPLRRRIAPDAETDKGYREWLATDLRNHVPELAEYDDPPIRWQWWRGLLYLAGFTTRDEAEAWGRQHGWMT